MPGWTTSRPFKQADKSGNSPGERMITLTVRRQPRHHAIRHQPAGRAQPSPPATARPPCWAVPSLFQAARMVADTLREVIEQHGRMAASASDRHVSTPRWSCWAARSPAARPRLFLIYPEGNFIEGGRRHALLPDGRNQVRPPHPGARLSTPRSQLRGRDEAACWSASIPRSRPI